MDTSTVPGACTQRTAHSSKVAKPLSTKCKILGRQRRGRPAKKCPETHGKHQEETNQSVFTPLESKDSFEDRYNVTHTVANTIVRRSDVAYFRGERRHDGEAVALAVHRLDAGPGQGIPRGAIREIALLKDAQHPNIMQLLDVYCDVQSAYVVFSHPGSLPHYDCLNAEAIRSLFVQLLLAVEFCHSRGVVLNNLKPQTVFIDAQACPPALRVGGFSSAQLLPMERRVVVLRTAWYSPPELLMDSAELLCLEGDVWNAGCILGELARGQALFPGDSEIGTLMLIFQGRGTPSETTWPGVSGLPSFSRSFPKWKAQAWSRRIQSKLGLGGVNLLNELLALDPRSRPSARQALRHPWLCGSETVASADLAKSRSRGRSVTKACSKKPFLEDADALAIVESFVGQNPQLVEYASDIDGHARDKEVFAVPRKDFWLGTDSSFEVGLRCRAILVDWMVSVCDKWTLKDSTLFLAVAIIDQYISNKQVVSGKFQCLGCAAMLTASKLDDELALEGNRLVDICDSCFTLAELMQMEVDLLNTIRFDLNSPTVPYFLNRFCAASGASDSQRVLAGYLAELTLLRVWDFQYPASHIAAASIALSNRLQKRAVTWPPCMAARTCYVECSESEHTPSLAECVSKLRALVEEIKHSKLQAISDKYAPKLGGVVLGEG
mmetsp:Transcript_102806/g.299852  ORF Transcript_102806/g.299852 Transcript_102806/m.299852 type:complete len:665 (-) Transcript_102806:259-2253(-)